MVTMVAGRSTVVNHEKGAGATSKKLKKNIIKQRAGKNTAVGASKKQSGFTSTATLKTRNHFESMSPKRDIAMDSQGGNGLGSIQLNANSILKRSSVDRHQQFNNTAGGGGG